jgi:hypothetical protein
VTAVTHRYAAVSTSSARNSRAPRSSALAYHGGPKRGLSQRHRRRDHRTTHRQHDCFRPGRSRRQGVGVVAEGRDSPTLRPHRLVRTSPTLLADLAEVLVKQVTMTPGCRLLPARSISPAPSRRENTRRKRGTSLRGATCKSRGILGCYRRALDGRWRTQWPVVATTRRRTESDPRSCGSCGRRRDPAKATVCTFVVGTHVSFTLRAGTRQQSPVGPGSTVLADCQSLARPWRTWADLSVRPPALRAFSMERVLTPDRRCCSLLSPA